ncbi:hypothetical protein PR048_033790 [Dryococelus australis]|uniref:CHK kinase-like domain-containing protein n=1 Tax=Dryococelus australis TaxID=614101 RepID=A0ABQ9G1S7_9NEOP|nr:hypothetical protein PR048_033790 [Dryococelus australis]
MNMASGVEITTELMGQIMREVEKDNSIVVLPCLQVHELNEDLHGGSCISRVTVTYTRHGDTSQHTLPVIVKVQPNISLLADIAHHSSVFPREIHMFDEILPRMSALLSKALPGRHSELSAQVYYTRKTPSYLIAIEDLSPKGFKAAKRKDGLDLKHCLLALKELARFHAASVMIHRDDKRLFTVFDKYIFLEPGLNEFTNKVYGRLIPIICQAIESWPEFGRSWADGVQHRYKMLIEDLKHVWKRDDNGFNVLNHGDFGVHNVMYRYSESSGEVEDIMFVDFQGCSYNSPVLDLIQFIFGSANIDVKANHIDTLLKEYHVELMATLEALGAPQHQTITLSHLISEFDSKMIYGFFYTVCFVPILSIDASTIPGFNIQDFFSINEMEFIIFGQLLQIHI